MRAAYAATVVLGLSMLCGCQRSADHDALVAQALNTQSAAASGNKVQGNAQAASPYCSSGGSEAQANCQSKLNALSAIVAPPSSKPASQAVGQ